MSSNTINTSNSSSSSWNYSESEIAQKFIFFNVLKDGRIHILDSPYNKTPPSTNPSSPVLTKDVNISADVSARIFLPTTATTTTTTPKKLPVFFYLHGGGFCMMSAYAEVYSRFMSQISEEANVIGVSVEYRQFPDHSISACYEDSWAALQWVASHADGPGSGPEPWINDYADLNRIFVGGDSAGANISHTLLAKASIIHQSRPSLEPALILGDAKIEVMILIHPYFGEDDKMWMYMCPKNEGPQDRRMKPAVEDLARIGCGRVLVILAEKDFLYGAGKMYAEELVKSGWKGKLEIIESKEKDHCFLYDDYLDPEANAIRQRIVSFINHEKYLR